MDDGLFSTEELDSYLTPEAKISKEMNAIFRAWYMSWYKDEDGNVRYTQTEAHICKEIKNALLKGVDGYRLEWALNILGDSAKPITPLNLQWSLGRVNDYMRNEGSASKNSNDNTYGEKFE